MTATTVDSRFRLGHRIAGGAHGEIYQATDEESGATVAIKILRQQSANSDEFLARFERECRLLSDLDHPNAVRIVATGLTPDNLPYVAMELVEGRTLSDVVHEEGVLAPKRASEYLNQIASVMDHAHSMQIIHRDIKPGNIMVCKDAAGNDVVKVLDFGVAKILHDDQQSATVVTAAGFTVGTPDYMSPEQAMGRAVDTRSDIYALGATMFACLTGTPPYSGKTQLAVMLAHVKKPIPRFVVANSDNMVPQNVEDVVRLAMAKDPEVRPQTAGEMARRFAEAVADPEPPNQQLATADTSPFGKEDTVPVDNLKQQRIRSTGPASVPPFVVAAFVALFIVALVSLLIMGNS